MTDRTGFRPDSGRQERAEGYVDVSFNQVVSGTPLKAFWIPAGATDITGSVSPITAFNSVTSDVLDVGTVGSGNAYKNDGNIAATTAFALTGLPVVSTQGFWMYLTWVGVGTAPTAGKFRLFVSYIQEGKAEFNHGEDQ